MVQRLPFVVAARQLAAMRDLSQPLSRPTAVAVAAAVIAYATWITLTMDRAPKDIDVTQLWYAAQALLAGKNPYAVVGPGLEYPWDWPLYYPLPAVLPFLAFAKLPLIYSQFAVVVVPSGVLAYLVARTDPRGLVLFLSRAFYMNVLFAQWMPLLMCAMFSPWFGFAIAMKPTAGLAMLARYDQRIKFMLGLATAGVLVVVSMLYWPEWPYHWSNATDNAAHIRPWILVPGGFVLLAALARWRHWEARTLLALAIVPQTWHTLATLPLVLLPRPLWGKCMVAAATFLPNLLVIRPPWGERLQAAQSFAEVTAVTGHLLLWVVWVPTLLLVLYGDGWRHPMIAGTKTRTADPPPPPATA
jgi:hypothetical protein